MTDPILLPVVNVLGAPPNSQQQFDLYKRMMEFMDAGGADRWFDLIKAIKADRAIQQHPLVALALGSDSATGDQ